MQSSLASLLPSAPTGAVPQSHVCEIGISSSDFDPARGPTPTAVYQRVNYVEYGGFMPPIQDADIASYLERFPEKHIGRHLVRTELVEKALGDDEVRKIRDDLAGVPVTYMVTDFGFWHLGPEKEMNTWSRPCTLTAQAARRIGRNVRFLEDRVGLPLFVENPYSEFFVGDLSLSGFMTRLATEGVRLCLDIGHFMAACCHQRHSLNVELSRLPFDAIGMCHIAGLAPVTYGSTNFLLDNHAVLPRAEAFLNLEKVLRKTNLQRVTYEAESAAADVQLAGLSKLERSAREHG